MEIHFQIQVHRNNDNATEKKTAITQRHPHVSIHICILYKKKTLYVLTFLYNNLTSMSVAFTQMCGHAI